MTACLWSDCWCRAWPPRRRVFSTGDDYTMAETAPGVYVYVKTTSNELDPITGPLKDAPVAALATIEKEIAE